MKAEPCAIVLFGITGDLARRKLLPSLYRLWKQELLPAGVKVVGFGRRDWTREQFRGEVAETLKKFAAPFDEGEFAKFAELLFYRKGGIEDGSGFDTLPGFLDSIDPERTTKENRLFYLSTPPEFYAAVAGKLAENGFGRRRRVCGGWHRIIVEKPFGRDLAGAADLNEKMRTAFSEDEVYRIDHYLGKETVQNILVFRFGNTIFEPIWNRRDVEHVQITASETLGVEGRGQYYETSGALRDMIQSHLLQLLSLVAMEPPARFDARSVHDEKLKVMRAVRAPTPETVAESAVRGQYVAGTMKNETVPGYRQEQGVAPESRRETYAAVRLFVDNWRWQGVPFYIRTGKRLPKKTTEIAVTFKQPPMRMFEPCSLEHVNPNVLIWRLQPEEGMSLSLEAKPPGPNVCVNTVKLDFSYQGTFGGEPREAYETLLLDCMEGDSMLYARYDWIEASWQHITPILQVWEGSAAPVPEYPAGKQGPAEADALTALDGHKWRKL